MIRSLFINPCFLALFGMCITFASMFGAKYWYTSFTKKFENPTLRRATNLVLGVATCFAISAGVLFAVADWFNYSLIVWTIIASALGATLLYLAIEKVFGESKINEAGKAVMEALSLSKLFDGKLTKNGLVKFTKGLLESVSNVGKVAMEKEDVAVEEAIKLFAGFCADGEITAEEKAHADKLLKGVNLEGNEVYEKYKALLNKGV